jgi:cytochrome c biogenesis protein CcdA
MPVRNKEDGMIRSDIDLARSSRRMRPLLLTGLAALAILVMTVTVVSAGAKVHLIYFYDPGCSICAAVHREVIEPLIASYGDQVAVDERSIADSAGFDLMLNLEQQFRVAAGSIPEVFIGQDALIGADEIRSRLKERVDYYLAQGGVEAPIVVATLAPSATGTPTRDDLAVGYTATPTASASLLTPTTQAGATPAGASRGNPVIHAAFFYQPGCDICERHEHDLQYIVDKYPQVEVHRFNVKEETALSQYLCVRAGVPEDLHLTAPMLFVGNAFLAGEQIRGRAIEALIQPYLKTGMAEPWAGWESEKGSAEGQIVERFRSLSLLTVIGAGLLDGVNPCAFATMIFLISYLSVRKRKGRELLATGAAFTIGVFLTYLGVGFGFLRFLASLPGLDVIGKWVYAITALLCLGLAWGSFMDYRKAREGRLEDMSLKLPERMRGWTHRLIREGSGVKRFVLASFGLGLVVSLIELACTGQVYLPTIIFVLGVPAWRARGALALVIYNVMFVLPLIGVFLLVYFGTTSKQLLGWMNRRTAAVKLGTAVLFLLLAAWLGYSILASMGLGAGAGSSQPPSIARIEPTATATPTVTPVPTSTPEPTRSFRVTLVDRVHRNVDTATITIKNCGIWTEQREKPGPEYRVQQDVSVAKQAAPTAGGAVVEIPEELKANLSAEVEDSYGQVFDGVKSEWDRVELLAGPDTWYEFVMLWMEDTFSSTVEFSMNGVQYAVPYTYTLRYPMGGGYRQLGCTA